MQFRPCRTARSLGSEFCNSHDRSQHVKRLTGQQLEKWLLSSKPFCFAWRGTPPWNKLSTLSEVTSIGKPWVQPYGRPPGLPAGVMPPGVVVPGEGAFTGVVAGTTLGLVAELSGWAVAGRRPGESGWPAGAAAPLGIAGRPEVLSRSAGAVRVESVVAPGALAGRE